VVRARAALDGQGQVMGYEVTSKGLSRSNIASNESDPAHSLLGMALGMPLKAEFALGTPADSYGFPAKLYAWEAIAPLEDRYSPLRTAHLRDPVGPEIHFASEQFIDELAIATDQDPVTFRLQYVKAPRDAAVIKAAAAKFGWQAGVGSRGKASAGVLHGRGIAYAQRSGTIVAVIAEVEVFPATGRIWARRFTVAHDCGLIINPRGLTQAVEGNVVQGVSRTLFEEVQFDGTSVLSVDWASYPILEMQDAPEQIEVVLIDGPTIAPSGAGEPTLRAVPAAIANAFFDATGVRMRRAPLNPERVKAALAPTSAA
jgi:CO/xanthine dehydrogenase Mo-binding subunit